MKHVAIALRYCEDARKSKVDICNSTEKIENTQCTTPKTKQNKLMDRRYFLINSIQTH